jgi:hypothetical protein
MNELADIGPVQLMSVGFDPGAKFEGRIADELARLEGERTIRVLDLLFVARTPTRTSWSCSSIRRRTQERSWALCWA